ncbi:MAG: DUF6323 family protein [Erysipelotrichaceae bacterium]
MDKYNLISKLNNNSDINTIKSYSTKRITITEETALNLIEHKNEVLKDTGRIELSFSALDLIIQTFINSSYLDQYCFKDTVYELTEIFYSLKNDTDDMISDKKLISILFDLFEDKCKGEIELLHKEAAELKEYFTEHRNIKGFNKS